MTGTAFAILAMFPKRTWMKKYQFSSKDMDEKYKFSSKDMDETDNLFSQRTWGAQWSREPGEQGALVFD